MLPAVWHGGSSDQVTPWSWLCQTSIAIRRSAALCPTEAPHSRVPAGIAPICRGSSNRAEQHRPSALARSWICPTSAKLAPPSVLR
ncbi:hypothetical protein [Actinacidiphila bryophytorum]|uniref:hypothetical protein n=1 Tax=Actinacidiphila bryophytorum TaxID=1436133 RepID=UPI002176A4A9|nr:hypothetical protein [Actinacidiphila bryophytorum]UWE10479.1 hypothetical protein NYE86_18300 [Actinacidiphila bryophytorum]